MAPGLGSVVQVDQMIPQKVSLGMLKSILGKREKFQKTLIQGWSVKILR